MKKLMMLLLMSAGCASTVSSMEVTTTIAAKPAGLEAQYFDFKSFSEALQKKLATEPENVLVSDIKKLVDEYPEFQFSFVGSGEKAQLYHRLSNSAANIVKAKKELTIQGKALIAREAPYQIRGARCAGDHPVLWPLAVPGLTLGQYVTMEDFIELGRRSKDEWLLIHEQVYALAINPATYNKETIVATLKSLVKTDMSYVFRGKMYRVFKRHIECTGYGDLEGFLEGEAAHK